MEKNQEISPDDYTNWFALYHLCQNMKNERAITISSVEFGEVLGVSQQTSSRRIQDLEKNGWIKRKIEGKTQTIELTENGLNILVKMYKNLKQILNNVVISGIVSEGMGEGGYYVAIKQYYDQFKEKLGFEPFKGTLNLELNDANNSILREIINNSPPIVIQGFKDEQREYGQVYCYKVAIYRLENREKKVTAALLDIKRTHHKKNTIEILANQYLRDYFKLKNGNEIVIDFNHK